MATQPFPQANAQADAIAAYGRRFEHRIKTKLGCYSFGPNLNTRPYEAKIRAALEHAEHSTEPDAILDTLSIIAGGGLPMVAVAAAVTATESVPPRVQPIKKPNTFEGVVPLLGQGESWETLRQFITYLIDLVQNARPVKFLYKPEEAAWALGFTFSAFNQSDWHKKIKLVKVGNLNRYRPEDLKTFTDNLPRSLPR